MTSLKSEFMQIAKERGFLYQCTHLDELDAVMAREKITAYIGFDCTAPGLHVGSLMQIMILRLLQQCGHTPLVLMGGGTTKVGDPSFKDEARKLLDDDQIAENMDGIQSVFKNYVTFSDNAGGARMVNNADWLDDLNYMTFLRDYGRYFSVNRMLSMDGVKLRMEREQNLSFLEFNYMILQAYDFVELHKKYGCQLQIGGSDQWGNIINGVELGRRAVTGDGSRFFGLTTPLITTSSGAKMGKTVGGAIWLNADMLSPFDYWQFWRNTEDADVGRFLRFFTELPIAEIARLESLQGAEINEAKKILANEATRLCHGDKAAAEVAETARKTFEEGSLSENLKTVEVGKELLAAGLPAFELFVLAGLKDSRGEARKLIEGGGGRINDVKLTDARAIISMEFVRDGYIKLSSGKKRHILVRPQV